MQYNTSRSEILKSSSCKFSIFVEMFDDGWISVSRDPWILVNQPAFTVISMWVGLFFQKNDLLERMRFSIDQSHRWSQSLTRMKMFILSIHLIWLQIDWVNEWRDKALSCCMFYSRWWWIIRNYMGKTFQSYSILAELLVFSRVRGYCSVHRKSNHSVYCSDVSIQLLKFWRKPLVKSCLSSMMFR